MLVEDCWSSLETEEQATLINYLTQNNSNCTLVAVTNDEAFARQCDRIILLHQGTIIKQGSFAEVQNSSEYKRMFRRLSL